MLPALASLVIPALWAPSATWVLQTPPSLLVSSLWSPAPLPGLETTVSPALPRPAPLQVRPTPQPHTWGPWDLSSRCLVPCVCPSPSSLSGPERWTGVGGMVGSLTPATQAIPESSYSVAEPTCPACCGRGAAWRTRQKVKWIVVNPLAGGCRDLWEHGMGSPWPAPNAPTEV